MILSNQVRCTKCGDTPFSANRHDFRSCKCGSIAVDGGMDYLRRVGDTSTYEEMSIEIDDQVVRKMIEAVQWADETGRNELGTVCAVMRALRDGGYHFRW